MSDSDEINVSYSPDANAPEVPARRPYTLVFVSDLKAGDRLSQLTAVDKETFADVLKRARPTLAVALKPPIGDGPQWEFALTFDAPGSFDPAGLLSQIPVARPRLALWEMIPDCRLGKISEADLERAIEAAAATDPSLAWVLAADETPAGPGAAAPAAPALPAVGSVLDLVEQPDETRRIAADVERLAAETPQPSKRISAAQASRQDRRRQRLQLELTAIADAVLKHPDFRRLELAWRTLKLLVDSMDFRAGVQLTVLDAPRDQAVARFNQRVGEPAFNGEIPTPGLVIWDYPYQNTPVDLAQLDELARVAAGLPVPVVFPLEAAFFGVKTPNLLKTLPNLSGLVDGWQFAKWRTLRDQRYSRCLVAVFGRFLLRAPHELRPEAREFTCAESAPSESSLFWAGGHVAFAVCAARSYATHGWPTRMFGAQAGKLADLPVVPNPADAQKPWGPGDATLPDRRLDEFPAIGINLLQGMPRTDHCILLGGVTVAKPVVTQQVGRQQATLEVSVPYQQFSNITGAWLCEQTPELHGVGEEEIKKRLLFGLRDLLRLSAEDSADAIMVGTGPAPDDPTRTIVQVRVTPPGRIVPGGLHVDFGFAVST